jgi:hypothetical protein
LKERERERERDKEKDTERGRQGDREEIVCMIEKGSF